MKLDIQRARSPADLRAFAGGAEAHDFEPTSRAEAYDHIRAVLRRFPYERLNRAERGVIRAYLRKSTGFSRAQLTRLLAQHRDTGPLRDRRRAAKPFARRYTDADIRLLADTDELHEDLSAPAIRHLCRRQHEVYGDRRYRRLAGISSSHLHNLRRRRLYRSRRLRVARTQPAARAIGARRRPEPRGQPGHLRVDTVHQGDRLDRYGALRAPGLYFLNFVDQVTQWELVLCVPYLRMRFVRPALEVALDYCPFPIRGFHSDNGSEFVNRSVGGLLEKLNVRFTRSRPRHSHDNGLVEGKNAAVVRRQFGHGHIDIGFAEDLNRFAIGVLSTHLNYHRPCWFPEEWRDDRGRRHVRYSPNRLRTPYEKLKSLPDAEAFLKPGLTFAALDRHERELSDNQSAERMRADRRRLFRAIHAARKAA